MKYVLFIAIILVSGCMRPDKESAKIEAPFGAAVSLGEVKGDKVREASGLVASINNPGMLWTHNDSGNDADIFLIDKTGTIKCTVHLASADNRDWEDITLGAGPIPGKNYLYIGEIGDNGAVHAEKFIYCVEEPNIKPQTTDTTLQRVDKITFKLSDGSRDTESLMLDPVSNDFYIFSKRESEVNLYKLSVRLSTTETMIAEKVLDHLPFTLIVAADISKDGSEILAKNYGEVFYWKRLPGESVETAIKKTPVMLPYKAEPQGESIAFDLNKTGYFTLSERKGKGVQHIYFYKRR